MKDTGIQAVGQLIAAVAVLIWEIFRHKDDEKEG